MGTAIPKLVAWLKLAFAWNQQLRGFTPFTHSEPNGWWKWGITSGMSRQIGCHTPCRPTDYIIFNVTKDGVNGCDWVSHGWELDPEKLDDVSC